MRLRWVLSRLMRLPRKLGVWLSVQLGDFGIDWPGKNKLHYGDRIQREASKISLTVAYTSGNHDCTDIAALAPGRTFTRIREDILHFDGAFLEWEGSIRIAFLGGTTSGDKEWRREEERKKRRPQSLW